MEIRCARYHGDAAEAKSRKDLIEASNTYVKVITTLTKSEDWIHIAGEHNPADLPSRGESPSKFVKSGWWEGPKWLQEKKEDWPISKVQYELVAIEEEKRKTVVAGFVAKKPKENPWYMNKNKEKSEVTQTQILIVIAWMLHFKPSKYKGDTIIQEELDSAEKFLVKITRVIRSLGVIYYELLQSNETITGERYQQQLMRLSRALKIKRPLYAKKHDKVIYQHDNARPHVAKVVKETLEALQWDVLPHPPYSPDISPSDHHMFRSMTLGLAEQHFTSYEEAKNWVDVWIASKDEEFFRHGIRMLPER
ncbi:hypothetical protein LAZ67_1006867 [Cordylochernes scorpioides]|uniref:Mariner Mos1 transposase n=1 Tax=Cordylochernes scorpioides TaxID=51811 RepID=A0ABY6K1V7_9ARAC|nr:hypothetical protein LAZ67_1006867 [Cordylochernes scorpioides]